MAQKWLFWTWFLKAVIYCSWEARNTGSSDISLLICLYQWQESPNTCMLHCPSQEHEVKLHGEPLSVLHRSEIVGWETNLRVENQEKEEDTAFCCFLTPCAWVQWTFLVAQRDRVHRNSGITEVWIISMTTRWWVFLVFWHSYLVVCSNSV